MSKKQTGTKKNTGKGATETAKTKGAKQAAEAPAPVLLPLAEQLGGSPLAAANAASWQNIPDAGNRDGSAKVGTTHTPRSQATKTKETKPKRVSALDAAAQVLVEAGVAMTCPELIDAMTKQKLWTSPNGQTPDRTLYAAMTREIHAKGAAARFAKADRGKFTAAGK